MKKTKLYYISPSIIPSRSANSIHVARMSEAFVALGYDVTLFACRSLPDKEKIVSEIKQFYGVHIDGMRVVSFFPKKAIALTLRIGLMVFAGFISDFIKRDLPGIIVSRNLYASFIIGVLLRYPIIYETHQPECGWKKTLQRMLMKCSRVTMIVISKALMLWIEKYHGFLPERFLILHDAAPCGFHRIEKKKKVSLQSKYFSEHCLEDYEAIVGYFGHLYPGRGIDIVQSLAHRCSNVLFFVFGGNEEEIIKLHQNNNNSNFVIMGHIPPSTVMVYMSIMDILLMPYQKCVSIGMKGVNTAQWMSPMKMFEYMSSGVPFIASKLPVLEEVLSDGKNCLLSSPDDVANWVSCLCRLMEDSELAQKIADTAYSEYVQKYNWDVRARSMIKHVT